MENAPANPTARSGPRWFGVVTLPDAMRWPLLRSLQTLAARMGPLRNWIAAGIALGVAPVVIDWLLGLYTSWIVTPFLILPLLLAAAVRDDARRGMSVLASTLLAHSLLTIAVANQQPERWAATFPEGEAYWQKSRRWIVTGVSEEYALTYWVPAQLQLSAAVVLLGYLSVGLTPLWQGFYEVDLMNTYVGRMLGQAHDPWTVLAVGWHPWSVCRGIGYLFLTFELASVSFAHLTGTPLSTRGRRLARWSLGLGFLALDMTLKWFLLESVRQSLSENLISN